MNVVKMELPSNSNKQKAIAAGKLTEKPPVEKVIKGKVIQKKPKLSKRLLDAFDVPESRGIAAYIFQDVAVPAIKDLIYTMGVGALSMSLFNEVCDRSRFGGNGRYRDYTSNFGKVTKLNGNGSQNALQKPLYRPQSSFDTITLENKGDAEDVLFRLAELVDTYGQATVADLYDAVGITKDYTSTRWGWTNLSDARIIAAKDGWLLDLPKEEELG